MLLAGLPVVFLLVAAAVLLVLGVVRGRLREPGGLALQSAGVLAFGAYLVAFVLLGHAAWDAYHHLRDEVVARSYAEFCGVVDLVLGVAILFVI